MLTNLMFKRQVCVDGVTKTVYRVVKVDIPNINSGEGWILHGHADEIELMTNDVTQDTPMNVVEKKEEPKKVLLKKFASNVPGTAKLVRSNGVIRIVARRGKTTYNQTTPDSVCIDDFVKQKFFRSCRDSFGVATSKFEFCANLDKTMFDYWNTFMDQEYQKQYVEANKN